MGESNSQCPKATVFETAVIAISPTAQASTATRIEATLGVIARHRRKTWSQDTRLEKWCKAI